KNQIAATHYVGLVVNDTGGKTLYDLNKSNSIRLEFVQPFVLNAVDPTRMLIATGLDVGVNTAHVYESFDQGDTLNDLFTMSSGTRQSMSMAYGGRRGGMDYPNVFYVGAGTDLYLRTTLGGAITKLTDYTGGPIRQVVLDPEDWQRAFVTDDYGHVWMTSDAGATPFTDINPNMSTVGGDSAIAVFNPGGAGGDDEILFGGANGVYRTINPSAGAGALWFPYGVNLPHAPVADLTYNTNDNVLVAGTFGRSAWTVPNADNTLISDLEIDGDTNSPGENDTIRLAADAANPAILDVYINSTTPIFSTYFSLINSIHVNGLGGNNTLIEDFSNGNPLPAGGLTYENATLQVSHLFVVTNTNDSGTGSLRQALTDANANADRDMISFDIPGSGVQTIEPLSALPEVTDPVLLDASTQPGYDGVPLVVLDGDRAGQNVVGIYLNAANSMVRGLVIQNFFDSGILAISAVGTDVIAGNYIGTDATGSQSAPNGFCGIEIDNSPNNTIGGTSSGDRNVISGNYAYGIEIVGSGSTGNRVMGNYVGTDATGTKSLGNSETGVFIFAGANGNRVGVDGADQDATAEANVISGNGYDGVGMEGAGTDNNIVAGNLIGTDVTGTIALGGNHYGVRVGSGASNNTIGSPGTNNDGDAERNVIAGNQWDGVFLTDSGTQGNKVVLNWIGSAKGGSAPLPNGSDGVHIVNSASDTQIYTNAIEFNQGAGVAVDSGTGNMIEANSIYANAGLGIDLGSDGVTLNHSGGSSSGPNDWQNYPVIQSDSYDGSTMTVQGDLNSTPNTTFDIALYHSPAPDPSDFGQGFLLASFFQVTTDASGNASFSKTISISLSFNDVISATATDPNGNTSEFSQVATLNNHAPSFTAGEPPAVNENSGAQTIAGWATFDPGPGANEADQTATYTVSNLGNAALFTVAPSVAPDGTLTYTLAPNQSGTSTFDVQVQDSGGTANGGVDTSAMETFTITVNSLADAPLSSAPADLTAPVAAEGAAFTNVTVFHFTDGDSSPVIGDYTATVTLGDGNTVQLTSVSSSHGQIVA
ncbi:MAG TPA: Ig-like domain-containing protein, partial [Pirellulales bacterium]|nr:Ig-like domain-containing protein [Pirellulales bacterium]